MHLKMCVMLSQFAVLCVVVTVIGESTANPTSRNQINLELASIAKKISSNTTQLLQIINASNQAYDANKSPNTNLAYRTMIKFDLFKKYPSDIPNNATGLRCNTLHQVFDILIPNIGFILMNSGILPQIITNEVLRSSQDIDRLNQLRKLYSDFQDILERLIRLRSPLECVKDAVQEVLTNCELEWSRAKVQNITTFEDRSQESMINIVEQRVNRIQWLLSDNTK